MSDPLPENPRRKREKAQAATRGRSAPLRRLPAVFRPAGEKRHLDHQSQRPQRGISIVAAAYDDCGTAGHASCLLPSHRWRSLSARRVPAAEQVPARTSKPQRAPGHSVADAPPQPRAAEFIDSLPAGGRRGVRVASDISLRIIRSCNPAAGRSRSLAAASDNSVFMSSAQPAPPGSAYLQASSGRRIPRPPPRLISAPHRRVPPKAAAHRLREPRGKVLGFGDRLGGSAYTPTMPYVGSTASAGRRQSPAQRHTPPECIHD